MTDKPERLGDAPIEARHIEQMNALARSLDREFNGEARGQDRPFGFVLLVFPFRDHSGRCNFISNGANRKDLVVLFKEMISRFEGMPETSGRG